MKRNRKIRHFLEALLIWTLPQALRPLPWKARVRVGGKLIGGAVRLVPSLKKRITDNLALIYPDMPEAEKKALTKRICRNIGERFIEVFYNRAFRKHVGEIRYAEGAFDEIISAQKAGRAVIMVSGHFGQWESVRIVLARMGYETAAIYKENANPYFERHHAKEVAIGAPMFATGAAGTRKMIKHLKSGGLLAVLLDQRAGDGVPIDFLGQPALTSTAMATLANRTGALLVPAYGVLRPDRQSCDIFIEPPIPHGDPVVMTTALNDSLSARVQKNPEQWYWLHKRWARPDLNIKAPSPAEN